MAAFAFTSHVAKELRPLDRASAASAGRLDEAPPTFREDPAFTFSEGVREAYWRVGVPGATLQDDVGHGSAEGPPGQPQGGPAPRKTAWGDGPLVQPGVACPAGTCWNSGRVFFLSF